MGAAAPSYIGIKFSNGDEQDVAGYSSANNVPLASGVSGTLPISNGGTGQTAAAAALTALGGQTSAQVSAAITTATAGMQTASDVAAAIVAALAAYDPPKSFKQVFLTMGA